MFYLSRSEQLALVVLLALLLTGAGLFTYARGRRLGRGAPSQPLFVEAARTPTPSADLVVDVAGAVSKPGVYRFPLGSRVADALDRAGGPLPVADLTQLNLAARINDQDKLWVPRRGDMAPAPQPRAAPQPTTQPISLNTATADQLESLPGIGPVYARRIIEYRERCRREQGHGFQSVDELLNVDGIGPKRFASIRDYVVP